MSLRFICIEVRRNLWCANVFLQFAESLTETEFLKINVGEHELELREYSTEMRIKLDNHFAIEARTISNLTIEECNASFRLTIGKLENEPEPDNVQLEKESQQNFPFTDWKPQLSEGSDDISVLCSNCKCNLTALQKIHRLREFPSTTIDSSEFFCHHGADFGETLVPQCTDLYYGFQFIVLNRDLLQKTVKERETHLYCNRCLQYLGETLIKGKAVKLWADTLQLQRNNLVSNIFTSPSDSSVMCTQSYLLLMKITRESCIHTEPLLRQLHFSKVLLIASFPNRQQKYLLLHILEKHLEVLRNSEALMHGGYHNGNTQQVHLEKYKCFKLLYHFIDIDTLKTQDTHKEEDMKQENKEESTTPKLKHKNETLLLDSWQHDISIQSLKISPILFSALLTELDENSLLLPELHRYTDDNFKLSYVFYIN